MSTLWERIFPMQSVVSRFDLERRPIEFLGIKVRLEGTDKSADFAAFEIQEKAHAE